MRKCLFILFFLLSIGGIAQPVISSFSPSSGAIGTVITITGNNFSTTPSGNTVFFGSVKALVTASSATSITTSVPAGAGYNPISVTVNNLTASSDQVFNVTFSINSTVIPSNFFIRQKSDSALKSTVITDLYNCDLDGDGKPDIISIIFTSFNITYPIPGSLPGAILVARNTTNASGVSFTDKQILTTGLEPSKIAFGDLDGDGKPDLITANQGDNTISVFRNISTPGNIAFDIRKDFAVGTNNSFISGYPNSVTIGDLNNDGKPDVIACVGDASIFSVFKNTSTPGSISFAARQDLGQFLNGLNAPVDILISDLNKDGKADIIFANISSDSGHVIIYRNTTTGDSISVANKIDIKINSYVWRLSSGDLDSDGLTDILIGDNVSNNLHVLRNTSTNGNISFANVMNIPVGPTLPNAASYLTGNCILNNFNGDNKPDIAIFSTQVIDSTFLLINTSSPGIISFTPNIIRTTGLSNPIVPYRTTSADFDGDGKQDIAENNDTYSMSVLLNKLGLIPSLTNFSPTFARTNDTITIKGNQLTYVSSVTFGGTPALSFSIVSDSLIKAPVGNGSSGYLVVKTSVSADSLPGFLLSGPPSINSYFPVSGSVGSLVTIKGNYLKSTNSVKIGGVSAILVSESDTQVVAIVMPGAVTGVVSLSTTFGTAISNSNFNVKATGFPNQQQGNKLLGSGGIYTSGDQGILEGQAVAVSADGNTAIVGGYADNNYIGAAWIYTRTGGLWTQQGNKLVGLGTGPGASNQGYAVAISADGNTAVVGGPGDNNVNGAAWVFTRTGNTWSQQGNKLVGSGAIGAAKQGFSVALSADGNTALIGGYHDNSSVGATWVFTRSNNAWTQQGSKLVGSGAIGTAQQSRAVYLSADGKTAIIGGYADNAFTGASWIFTRNDTTWIQQGNKLIGSGASGAAKQGWSVALSADGNTAIEGGYFDSSQVGAAWIFTRSGNQWTQQGSKLVGSDAAGIAQQGWSVSLSADGNTALEGGPLDTLIGGGVWVFGRTGNTWAQKGPKLTSTDFNGFAGQGNFVSLSLDASTAIVGGPWDNNYVGAAWAFIASPMISVTGNLSSFTSCIGVASSSQSINVSGNNLSNNITITAPAGFEVSVSAGSGFNNSISLTQNNGTLNNTPVYVRLAASASGTPSGNISFISTGATIQNFAVSGTLNPLPAIPTLTPNKSTVLCSGDSVILSSSVASSNQWYKNQVAIPGATSVSYTIAFSGVYADSITNSFGCKSGSILDTVVVNPLPSIPTLSLSKSSPICFGDSIIISSSASKGNQWYKNNIAIPGVTGVSYTVGYSGVYSDSITTSAGCKSSSSLDTIIVNPLPVKPIISANKTGPICFGDSIILSSSASTGNQWYKNNIAIPAATGVSYTVGFSGVYADSISNSSGCKAGSVLDTITVNPLPAIPVLTANKSTHINTGDSIQFTSSVTLGNQWYKNQVLVNGATGINFSTNQNGIYTDTVTNTSGCKSGSAPVSVSVNTFPIISSFAPSSGNIGSSIVITGYNFSSIPSNNLVYFGSVKANVTASTSNSITAVIPVGAGYLPISVTVNNLTAYSNYLFNVTYIVNTAVIPNNFFIRQKADSALKTAPLGDLYNWDLDGDGKPDLISIIYSNINGSNSISGSLPGAILVARNTTNTSGVSFTDKQILTTGLEPSKIVFGDLDGDGKPELITANQGDNTISIFRNISTPGNIAFDTRKDFAVGTNNPNASGYPNSVAIGDLNNDGKPDLIACVGDASIFSVFRNTSTPGAISFATRQELGQLLNGLNAPVDVLVTDLDKDGKVDIVFSNISSDSGHLVIYRNTTTGDSISVANKQDIKINAYVWKLWASDLDSDGLTDILTADNVSNNIHVLRNTSTNGNISFATVMNIPVGPALPNGLAYPSANFILNNFNGDSKPDIAVVTNTNLDSSFLLINTSNPGNISFSPYIIKTGNPYVNQLTSADFDGDGKQDIAGNDIYSISVLLNKLGMVPSITSFSPTLASTNDTIVIKGNGLTTVSSVSFGGTPALSFSVVSDSLIKAVVGSGASGNVIITSPARVDSLPGFIYGLPEINVSDSTKTNLAFGSFLNTNSTNQFFILTGKRLRDSMYLKATHSDTAAHPNFMMSLYPDSLFSTRLSLAPKNYTLDSTKIYVRFNTNTAGSFTDTIAISSAKAVSKNISLIGRACDSTISITPIINSITADSNICVRDSVILSSATSYNYYKWSTGDTTASITAKVQGSISLQVAKQVGCYSKASPLAKIIKDINPIPSLAITVDTVLISTSASNYRWYFNNTIIPGNISSQLIVNKIGFYRVETSNDKICWDASPDFNIVILANRLVNDTISIRAYPNPASGGTFNVVATLQRATNVIASITVTDINGATLLQTSKFIFFGNQVKIPINLYSTKGTVVVKVNVNGDIKTITVIVQ